MQKASPFILVAILLIITSFTPEKKKITIFSIGDSTMANKDTSKNNPERGWCQVLPAFFDENQLVIDNRAK
ncbi:MAG TPA: hypothetical protein VN249_13785, partial [Prolixibacteraceae bacterium]|nr:hypothetical protein [Prolixibacteraceae bacterium]